MTVPVAEGSIPARSPRPPDGTWSSLLASPMAAGALALGALGVA
jgi:hypothetical protein